MSPSLVIAGAAALAAVCGGALFLWGRLGAAIMLDFAGVFCL